MYGESIPAAGIITGIGRVAGRECMIVANDATVKGGTYYPVTVKKHLRAQEIALEKPAALHLSGGQWRREFAAPGRLFPDAQHFGRIFYNQAQNVGGRHSAARSRDGDVHRGRRLHTGHVRPVGDCAQPGHDFSGWAATGEAATGEIATAEEIGGADVHSRVSGVTDYYAQNDTHALAIARRITGLLNRVKQPALELWPPQEPRYDPAELYGVGPGRHPQAV